MARALAEVATEENPSILSQEEIREQVEKEGIFNSYRANNPSKLTSAPPGAKQLNLKNETPLYSGFKYNQTQTAIPNVSNKGSELTDFSKN
ncbi:hypothetical protein GcM3_210046 [Golovinomyces cichoracearum]|uniref:Uncharacterized protein n=1 Tax=Golovinomyces cichoracearum TaxID=62708 RepID=A0A420HA81_9PEZI|nr:hypothetical protein GcM3_210046 [Golovinomyces cichoracearum]